MALKIESLDIVSIMKVASLDIVSINVASFGYETVLFVAFKLVQ